MKYGTLALLALAGCYVPSYTRVTTLPGPEMPVSREEAGRLAAAGVSDPVILDAVDRRGAFALSTEDVVALKKAGVSDAVAERMIAAKRNPPPPTGGEGPVIVEHTYVYDRPYYYSSFGFGYASSWRYYGRPAYCPPYRSGIYYGRVHR